MQTEKRLTDYFDQIRIVNLPSRQDRRREVIEQLHKIDLTVGQDGIAFFEAVRPAEANGFPSIGANGCFQSHLQLLKAALAANSQQLLVLEDDVNFVDNFSAGLADMLKALQRWQWDICYLGHTFTLGNDKPPGFSYCSEPIATSHAYAINAKTLPLLIDYLETVLTRPPGHPLGGPMHYDGAMSMFRAQNPHIKTLILTPPVVYQRPSRTDIHDLAFYDRLPGIRLLANWARKLKARMLPK